MNTCGCGGRPKSKKSQQNELLLSLKRVNDVYPGTEYVCVFCPKQNFTSVTLKGRNKQYPNLLIEDYIVLGDVCPNMVEDGPLINTSALASKQIYTLMEITKTFSSALSEPSYCPSIHITMDNNIILSIVNLGVKNAIMVFTTNSSDSFDYEENDEKLIPLLRNIIDNVNEILL